MAMMVARPTAPPAAATVITKKTKTCPSREWRKRAKATKLRLTALSISSMDMKMTRALRRVATPATPTAKRKALRKRYAHSGTMDLSLQLSFGEDHRPDHGREQDHRCQLEGDQVFAKEDAAHRLGIPHSPDGLEIVGAPRSQHNVGTDAEGQLGQQEAGQDEPDADPDGVRADRRAVLRPQIEQHDDEQEEDHDGSGIHEDVHEGDQLRTEEDVEAGLRKEREDQAEGAVDRTALQHHPHGCPRGHKGKDEKEDPPHPSPQETMRSAAAVNITLTRAAGSRTFHPKPMSWS